jgi:hypothetical protein
MPQSLDGAETWSGWRECDFGYPLVNYVSNGSGLQCAYLTEHESGLSVGVKADIARVRMVVARSRLRELSTVVVTCGVCGEVLSHEPHTEPCMAIRPPEAALGGRA